MENRIIITRNIDGVSYRALLDTEVETSTIHKWGFVSIKNKPGLDDRKMNM